MNAQVPRLPWSTALVVLAALCWGVSGGIGGILMAGGWSPFVVSLYRGAVGLVFVLAWLVLRPRGSGLGSRRMWSWSALAGLGVAGNFAFYFVAIAESGVAVAATLMYCAPIFVYAVSFALGIEKPTATKWIALALVIFGIVLLTRVHEVGAGDITPTGLGAGLLAGVSYAVFIFGFKGAAPHGSPQAVLSIAFAVLVVVLPWTAGRDQVTAVPHAPEWPLFAVLGVLGAGLSFILYVRGLKYIAPAVASIVALVEPVTASVFGVVVLDEALVGSQMLGMALILVAVTGLGVHTNCRRRPGGS